MRLLNFSKKLYNKSKNLKEIRGIRGNKKIIIFMKKIKKKEAHNNNSTIQNLSNKIKFYARITPTEKHFSQRYQAHHPKILKIRQGLLAKTVPQPPDKHKKHNKYNSLLF